MRGWKTATAFLFLLLCATAGFTQSAIQQASDQFAAAQKAEAALDRKLPAQRSRNDYVSVIRSYERVYLITPHTSYADNALTAIAKLYEEIEDTQNALKTLRFLLQEYPQTPLRQAAERSIARLGKPAPAPAPTQTPVVAVSAAPVSVPSNTSGDAQVENIRYWEEGGTIRIVVDMNGEATFKQGGATGPDRVFVDISPARLSPALKGKEWVVPSSMFQRIRAGQFSESTVRVVLDGVTPKAVNSFTLREPDRLVIDIAGTGAALVASNTSSATAPVTISSAAPAGAAAVAAPAPPPDAPRMVTAAKPSSLGDRSMIRSLGLKISRVIIDAGHGGHDTGSIGPTGLTEKELVLDVAKRLKTLIETEMGIEALMTRTEDVFIPLESRTLTANKVEADLFISIHANSSQSRTARGVETFFLDLNAQSREAVETASRENAAANLTIHQQQDVLRKIMLNDKVDESRELAGHIQTAMSGRKDAGPNRGVKQAPFVVLIGATMPSILTEIAFISHPDEERQLKTPQYRQQIAESLLQGVRSYSDTLSGIKAAKSLEQDQQASQAASSGR